MLRQKNGPRKSSDRVRTARAKEWTHTHTDTQNDYSNPRACAPRVNDSGLKNKSITPQVAAVPYLGGTVSKDLAKSLWTWWNIHIIAQHLPGVQNVIADAQSRTMRDRSGWQLNPVIFMNSAEGFAL